MEPIIARAAITDGCGNFSIEKIMVDAPAPDEVLVKITAAGLCHTDYDSLSWGRKMVLGHEGAGVVVKKGIAVQHVSEGDKVVLNWAIPCGECPQCKAGNLHICELNSPVTGKNNGQYGHAHARGCLHNGESISRSFNLGTLSEFTLVKQEAVIRNTATGMTDAGAAIMGCGVMTGVGSVLNAARVIPGSSVVVIGAGGVGYNVIQGARLAGASYIIAIDINENRFGMARNMGATHTVLAQKNDNGLLNAAREVAEILGGRLADYAFECTANPALGAAPLAMVRNAGTAIQVSGIEQEINIDMNLFEWDKIYMNPLYGKCNPTIDFPRLMHLYDTGQLYLEPLVTTTYSIDDLAMAFDDLLAGKNAKGVILF